MKPPAVRTLVAALAALGVLGASLQSVGRAAARRHVARPPARLLVYAQEWSLWGSRSSVPSGRVSVELWNRGQDAHDLRIQRIGAGGGPAGKVQGVRVTRSGSLSQASWRLRRGRYLLFCSMPGHEARGMHTVLSVR